MEATYLSKCEKAGIPTVLVGFSDQVLFAKRTGLLNGCPSLRFVVAARMGSGAERVAACYDQVIKALTDPLTADEKAGGLYTPASVPRICFEGTLDDAQAFFAQTTLIDNCRKCPIATWTDGLPIIIPTEAKVAEMLTGTSHKPSEKIAHPLDRSATVKAGTQVVFAASYVASVEKVAVCAVMAGCKPEYLPAALAIACSGGASTNCPGTSSAPGVIFFVSGPFAKEIGMDSGQTAMDVGNIANMTLGRVGALMTVDFGGCITGIVRTDHGGPVHSVCFAEDLDGLPAGWRSFAEESTYYKDGKTVNFTSKESVVGKMGVNMIVTGVNFPGSFRVYALGVGGLARQILKPKGIAEGTPGPWNWLEALLPTFVQMKRMPGGATIVCNPNMAEWLREAGFKDKQDVYQWMVDTYTITAGYYRDLGGWEFVTAGGLNIEPTSGKRYMDLPDDYPLRAFGNSAMGNNIVVSAHFGDEMYWIYNNGRAAAYPIDAWR